MDEVYAELGTNDAKIVKKMHDLCTRKAFDFQEAVESGDILGIIEAFFNEVSDHLDDLNDLVGDPELKAMTALAIANLRVETENAVHNARVNED